MAKGMVWAHLSLLLINLIYALFYVGIKVLVAQMPIWDVFLLRLLLAAPLLFIIEYTCFKTRIHALTDWFKIAGLGLLGIILVQSTVVIGVKYTSVSHTGFITGLSPLFTLIISYWLGQETFTRHKCLGMGVAFTGLLALIGEQSGPNTPQTTTWYGDAMITFNIFLWSLFLILSKRMVTRYPAFSLTAWAFVLSGLMILPTIWFSHHGQWPQFHLSVDGWLWMAFIVICSTIGTYFLYFYALSKLSASTCALYVYLQPLFTVASSFILLHEPLTSTLLLSGLLIVLGVVIANQSPNRPLTTVKPE